MREGRGFVIRTAGDTPWSGWMGLGALEAFQEDPWRLLAAVAECCALFPGGFALIEDADLLARLDPPARVAWLEACGRLPGLTLHVQERAWLEGLRTPVPAWLHVAEPPAGPEGEAWRQGLWGWCSLREGVFPLPGVGAASLEEQRIQVAACWGEVLLPVSVLAHLQGEELVLAMADLQAGLEQALSQRIGQGAWPRAFPFQRRRAVWRMGLVGGREFAAAGGDWEEAAGHLARLIRLLEERLRASVQGVASEDARMAALLGHQAMREGHPWRSVLPLPPASPCFASGLAVDPRESSPLESRAFVPAPLVAHLVAPPVARLRVPAVPGDAAVQTFLRGLPHPAPALQWLPPAVPPPAPYLPERPWPQARAYPPVPEVTSALQPSLFQETEWS